MTTPRNPRRRVAALAPTVTRPLKKFDTQAHRSVIAAQSVGDSSSAKGHIEITAGIVVLPSATRASVISPTTIGSGTRRGITASTLQPPALPSEAFFGRDHEMQKIMTWWQDPNAASALVLSGHALMGKRELVLQFVNTLKRHSAKQPRVTLLDRPPPPGWDEAAAAANLWYQLNHTRPREDDIPATLDACIRALRQKNPSTPSLLVIIDAQDSAIALRRLPEGLRLIVTATEPARNPRVREISLEPLESTEIERFLLHAASNGDPETSVKPYAERVGGVPGILAAICRAIETNQKFSFNRPSPFGSAPPNDDYVAQAVETMVSSFQNARDIAVLRALAAFPEVGATASQISLVAECPPEICEKSLGKTVGGLVERRGIVYAFHRPLYRAAVKHLRPGNKLARQWLRKMAVRAVRLAAAEAQARGPTGDLLAELVTKQTGLFADQRWPPTDVAATELSLAILVSDAFRGRDESETRLSLLRRAEKLQARDPNGETQCQIWLAMVRLEMERCNDSIVIELLDRVRSEALGPRLSVHSWIAFFIAQGDLLIRQGDPTVAYVAFNHAAAVANAVDALQCLSEALRRASFAQREAGDFEGAWATMRKAIRVACNDRAEHDIALMLRLSALLMMDRNDLPKAERLAWRSRARFEHLGSLVGMANAHDVLGDIAVKAGSPCDAESHYSMAIRIANELPDPELVRQIEEKVGTSIKGPTCPQPI
jgi:hypothetical protein